MLGVRGVFCYLRRGLDTCCDGVYYVVLAGMMQRAHGKNSWTVTFMLMRGRISDGGIDGEQLMFSSQ